MGNNQKEKQKNYHPNPYYPYRNNMNIYAKYQYKPTPQKITGNNHNYKAFYNNAMNKNNYPYNKQ